MSCFISIASPLWWPWQWIALWPPVVSMHTCANSRSVSTFTDATCAMLIDCSSWPNHCGV